MIGVIANEGDNAAVEEFFQLFKTPWEPYRRGQEYDVVIAAVEDIPEVDARLLMVFASRMTSIDARHGIVLGGTTCNAEVRHRERAVPIYGDTRVFSAPAGAAVITSDQGCAGVMLQLADRRILRLGYDLFHEIRQLLISGQPLERAAVPAIDDHIGMVREWIIDAGAPLIEVLPTPAERQFTVCLTHDIDFVGIRHHRFDHTMWGFLYRATVGALQRFLGGRMSLARFLQSLRAAAALPLVHLGVAKDFWLPFEWYLKVEKGLPATYYLIPYKGRAGDKVRSKNAHMRACSYELQELEQWIVRLTHAGNEVGVHGIDSWHDANRGRAELERIRNMTSDAEIGIRMHWLQQGEDTYRILEEAGYSYDSTSGYNEAPGYRNGTSQVFRPIGCHTLLELPLHVQDGALFLRDRLNLSESMAQGLVDNFIAHARRDGGVLTILWHDRSHAAERFWGDFYVQLLQKLKAMNVWFASARQVVGWFRRRRGVRFVRGHAPATRGWIEPDGVGTAVVPPFTVRVYQPICSDSGVRAPMGTLYRYIDHVWTGESAVNLDRLAVENGAR